jgi:hypothetical protein
MIGTLTCFLLAGTSLDEAALKKCAAIEEPLRRLECFDALTEKKGYRPQLPKSSSAAWTVTEEVSPVDDSAIVTASRDADGELLAWPGKKVTPTLILRCQSRRLEVFVSTGMAEAGDSTEVTLRFDKQPAYAERWSHSTSGNALFLPGAPSTELDFVSKLRAHEKLLIQVTPYNSSPTMTTFTLAGTAEAAERVKRACGYGVREIPPLGIKYVTSSKELAKQHGVPQLARGVLVIEVPPDSIAAGRLAPGDLIVGLNGKSILNADTLDAALHELAQVQHEGRIVIEYFRRMDTFTFSY